LAPEPPPHSKLAVCGGRPVRRQLLPYGRHWIDHDDVAAVVDALQSDWLTTGPIIAAFEGAFAKACAAEEAVALSSGTAALHGCMHALGVGVGDEVIVPPMTFVATANCVLYVGGTPVFADVDPGTLLLDPAAVEEKISRRTRAIIAVDYAGQPCDYSALRAIADRHGLALVADACHALGGRDRGGAVGSLADLTAFSLHPVKHITTAEGGVVTTRDPELARRLRAFRSHGITGDHRQREMAGSWYYEMTELGYNYRITDVQCALGMSQLRRLRSWVDRRQQIATTFIKGLAGLRGVQPLVVREGVSHAYHLFVIRLDPMMDRALAFAAMRAEGIGVNVHYIPVHLHPYYRTRLGTGPGLCPAAEAAYQSILSLPMFPRMSDEDVRDVVVAVRKVVPALAENLAATAPPCS
jgi:perosamine synthetase